MSGAPTLPSLGPSPEVDAVVDRRRFVGQLWQGALVSLAAGVVGTQASRAEGEVGEAASRSAATDFQHADLDAGDGGAGEGEGTVVEKEVTYLEFNQLLLKKQVASCRFYGASLNRAVITLKDGTQATIGEGYPVESPYNNSSPMRVVGQLRNAGVPYVIKYDLEGYSKPQSYKTKETAEAEARQRREDKEIERLMAE